MALAFEERDWLLITQFENLTGETVFDGSLDTAMTVLSTTMITNTPITITRGSAAAVEWSAWPIASRKTSKKLTTP